MCGGLSHGILPEAVGRQHSISCPSLPVFLDTSMPPPWGETEGVRDQEKDQERGEAAFETPPPPPPPPHSPALHTPLLIAFLPDSLRLNNNSSSSPVALHCLLMMLTPRIITHAGRRAHATLHSHRHTVFFFCQLGTRDLPSDWPEATMTPNGA